MATIALMTGLGTAQTYPPPTTPPEIPAPGIGIPAPGTPTTTIVPSPNGGYQSITRHGTDQHGNPVGARGIYRGGSSVSSESHQTWTTDPGAGGTTFRSTITHNPQ